MTMSDSQMGDLDRRRNGKLEQHIQTILISVITGAVVFTANYFYQDNREKAIQQTQLEVLTSQVIEMRSDLRALQSAYARKDDVKEIEARVRLLERQIK